MDLQPVSLLPLVNQVFELEKKLTKIDQAQKTQRNLRRIRESLEELGMQYHNPLGEPYDETRTDCEASIAGEETENLFITEVLKPIVHLKSDGNVQLLQPGLVIVAAK